MHKKAKELMNDIDNFLILERGMSVGDCEWKRMYRQWDKSDCSKAGLCLVLHQYFLEQEQGDRE